jgi:nicotinamide mononucleotide transporter
MEIFAFLLSLACVLLNAYGKILTWPLAMISSTAYAYVFFNSQLFGDAALQFVFVGLAMYAWITWYKRDCALASSTLETKSSFSRVPLGAIPKCSIAWLLMFVVIQYILKNYTSSDVPNLDAFLTAGSLLATYMSAQKWLENWLLWAFVDVIYIGLYVYKDLYLTALLYGLLIALCLLGWRQWSNQMKVKESS